MPRGFLVKRTQKHHSSTSRIRSSEDDDRTEPGSGSDLDSPLPLHTYPHPYGSPDSGFSQSPVNLTVRTNRNVDADGLRSEDGQSDCQSTSGKETLASDASSGSDVDDAHVQARPEPRPTRENATSPPHVHGPAVPASRTTCYGLPSHPSAAPLSISTSNINSPSFYFSAFDRLSVTSPKGYGFGRTAPPPPPPPSSYLHPAGLFAAGFPALGPGRLIQNTAATTISPNKRKSPEHPTTGVTPKTKSAKKPKAARRIHFDEDKSSPVSGTIIRDPSDVDDDATGIRVVSGDIDSSLNFVEVTPEAREELAKIENRIGDYICQLCKEHYDDAFQLAQHRCSRIIHVEYRCPECDKVFNCPANLASHRRWHKPRPNGTTGSVTTTTNNNNSSSQNNQNNNNNNNSSSQNNNDNSGKTKNDAKRTLSAINGNLTNGHIAPAMFLDGIDKLVENIIQTGRRSTPSPDEHMAEGEAPYECQKCGKKFRRQAYLRKHVLSHLAAGSGGGQEMNATSALAGTTYPCPVCGKTFGCQSARAKHVVQTHGSLTSPPPTSSPSAAATTSSATGVSKPRATLARGADDFACALCGQCLAGQLDLEQHQRLRHPNEIYACKYCTAVFYSSPGLTRHINKCHPTESRQMILLHMPPAISQINSPC